MISTHPSFHPSIHQPIHLLLLTSCPLLPSHIVHVFWGDPAIQVKLETYSIQLVFNRGSFGGTGPESFTRELSGNILHRCPGYLFWLLSVQRSNSSTVSHSQRAVLLTLSLRKSPDILLQTSSEAQAVHSSRVYQFMFFPCQKSDISNS